MNILFFTPVYKPAWRYGGPVRSISETCEGLAALGSKVTVATTNANGDSVLEVPINYVQNVDGVSVTYFERSFPHTYIESASLRKRANQCVMSSDIVHLNAVWQPLALSISSAALRNRVPYICSLRGTVNSWTWHQRKLKHRVFWCLFEKRQLRNASALHVTCDAEKRDVLACGVGDNQDVVVIPNPIDYSKYVRTECGANEFRTAFGITGDTTVILYMGRLHPKKGIDLFLNSVAQSLHVYQNCLFIVAGPSENGYGDTLRALTLQLGIGQQVRFVGLLSEKDRLNALSAADLFVLTSHNENFGMSVVEAMSASIPVLISNKVGIALEIEQDGAGCVTSLESDEINRAFVRMLSNTVLREQYSRNGRLCVQRRFATESVAKRFIEAYAAIYSESALIRSLSHQS